MATDDELEFLLGEAGRSEMPDPVFETNLLARVEAEYQRAPDVEATDVATAPLIDLEASMQGRRRRTGSRRPLLYVAAVIVLLAVAYSVMYSGDDPVDTVSNPEPAVPSTTTTAPAVDWAAFEGVCEAHADALVTIIGDGGLDSGDQGNEAALARGREFDRYRVVVDAMVDALPVSLAEPEVRSELDAVDLIVTGEASPNNPTAWPESLSVARRLLALMNSANGLGADRCPAP